MSSSPETSPSPSLAPTDTLSPSCTAAVAISAPSPSASPGTRWHFPGPSSRYHHRERSRTQSRPGGINVTHAVGPVLSTERRAHRRAQSSYNVPTSGAVCDSPRRSHLRKHSTPLLHGHAHSALSPTSSDCTRSPLSRFASYPSASNRAMADPVAPVTPGKSPFGGGPRSMLQDSPFSDYFTDDGRSVDEPGADKPTTTLETRRLLARLARLQDTLISGDDNSQALRIVERRMGGIEGDIEALHAQNRQPAELEDSGLFLDEEEDIEDQDKRRDSQQQQRHRPRILQFGLDGVSETPWPEQGGRTDTSTRHREQSLLAEAQRVLESVTNAQNELRKRYDELRNFNHEHSMELEEKEEELERLRYENEALKSDLYFDHTELLLLESQIKHLETTVEVQSDEGTSPELNEAIGALKEDWTETLERFHRRRKRYPDGGDALLKRDSEVFDGGWKLEISRKPKGRVASLTLRRVDDEGIEDSASSVGEKEDDTVETRPSRTRPTYSTRETQTDTYTLPAMSVTGLFPSQDELAEDDSFHAAQSPRRLIVEFDGVGDDDDDDDCAITTSPPSDAGVECVLGENDSTQPRKSDFETAAAGDVCGVKSAGSRERSAWQELWEGMANLAGMGEERW